MARTTRPAKTARPSILGEGGFAAFVLDQLSALDGIHAKAMFGGAGLYADDEFFGIIYKQRLYFRVSPETIDEYTRRKMKPFAPFKGRKVSSRRYYEVPLEILESPPDLVRWAKTARRATALEPKPRKRSRSQR